MAFFNFFKRKNKDKQEQEIKQEQSVQPVVDDNIEENIESSKPAESFDNVMEKAINDIATEPALENIKIKNIEKEVEVEPVKEDISPILESKTEEITSDIQESETKTEETISDVQLTEPKAKETSSDIQVTEPKTEETFSNVQVPETKAEETISDVQVPETKAEETISDVQVPKTKTEETISDVQNPKTKVEETLSDVQNPVELEKPKKKGFFAKIKAGLNKTRENIMSGVEQVLKSFTKIDEELFEELEEALIMSDIGVETSLAIIEKVKDIVKTEKISDVNEIKGVIVRVITEMLEKDSTELEIKTPTVILVIGVNGVGKTTTIGKLTHNYKEQGKKVVLAAADTFRAAAIDQLQVWGDRSGVDVIKHQENSDPGAVVFDAVQAAKARNADILICDTAGRLHNKKNLMEELKKIAKIINREYPEANVESFLVLDATTGQNALQQAKLFNEVADITGIVLTKLDGTAKGGIVIAIKNELQIPVRYIGVGEGIDDLQKFNATEFAKALFDME